MSHTSLATYANAIEIFQAGLKAVAPGTAIKSIVQCSKNILTVRDQQYDLNQYEDVIVIGAGKAGASMAKAVEDILGQRITKGLITVKYGHVEPLKTIELVEAGHPVPDENGICAANKMIQLAHEAGEKSLVICLISGGGSALLPLPVDGVSLMDKQETTKVLLGCGATIHEINAIRKHLSVIKGGCLARAVYPATLITLILSDVVGDDLDSIASGPCVPDPRTFADCLAILDKYDITAQIPVNVLNYLSSGNEGQVAETPKHGEIFFTKTQNEIVASNFNALLKASQKAESLGFNTLLLSSMLEGETREVACNHIAIVREIKKHGYPLKTPACLLSGGETTVKIRGEGKGGRNQEFVLAASIRMADIKNVVILSAGTDGNDGPTDAAGALADDTTLVRAEQLEIDPKMYLDHNDSYNFFDMLGDLYKTGPTNTNVMDLRIILIDQVTP